MFKRYRKASQSPIPADCNISHIAAGLSNYLIHIDDGGRQKIVGEEDLKKLKGEMTKYT